MGKGETAGLCLGRAQRMEPLLGLPQFIRAVLSVPLFSLEEPCCSEGRHGAKAEPRAQQLQDRREGHCLCPPSAHCPLQLSAGAQMGRDEQGLMGTAYSCPWHRGHWLWHAQRALPLQGSVGCLPSLQPQDTSGGVNVCQAIIRL